VGGGGDRAGLCFQLCLSRSGGRTRMVAGASAVDFAGAGCDCAVAAPPMAVAARSAVGVVRPGSASQLSSDAAACLRHLVFVADCATARTGRRIGGRPPAPPPIPRGPVHRSAHRQRRIHRRSAARGPRADRRQRLRVTLPTGGNSDFVLVPARQQSGQRLHRSDRTHPIRGEPGLRRAIPGMVGCGPVPGRAFRDRRVDAV
jgi:hypothetical protein